MWICSMFAGCVVLRCVYINDISIDVTHQKFASVDLVDGSASAANIVI